MSYVAAAALVILVYATGRVLLALGRWLFDWLEDPGRKR